MWSSDRTLPELDTYNHTELGITEKGLFGRLIEFDDKLFLFGIVNETIWL